MTKYNDDKMIDHIEDGGAAFPRPGHECAYGHQVGMSLRDWFAGQALAGWLASFGPDDGVKPTGCANFAYSIADAMLEARK